MGIIEIRLWGRYGQGKVARVDERFAEAVRPHKWYLSDGCANATIGGVTVPLHRYILALADVSIPRRINHVNRDKLDCRLENLTPRPVGTSPGLIVNPHPLGGGDSEQHLSAPELDTSERLLRAYLTARQTELELQADEGLLIATARIVTLTMEGLTKTRAAWWSSLGGWDVHAINNIHVAPHIGPKPPRRPRAGDLWWDTSCQPQVVREYSPRSTWSSVLDDISPGMSQRAVRSVLATLLSGVEVRVRWPRLIALHEDVKMLVGNRLGWVGRNDRPAYLACATLAALLETETKHVVDLLANYRRGLTTASARLSFSKP
jgi:hypothetical protein